MQSDKEVVVSYGLREKSGKRRLVRIFSEENGRDANCCGERKYSLTFMDGYPLYRVDSPETAAMVLSRNTEWYNSDPDRPSWEGMDVAKLMVVKITESIEVETVDITPPLLLKESIDTFSKFRSIAAKYLGRPLPDIDFRSWTMRLVHIPEDETFDSLQARCTNRLVLVGSLTFAEYCWGVFELPEEYLELAKGRPAVGLITTERAPEPEELAAVAVKPGVSA